MSSRREEQSHSGYVYLVIPPELKGTNRAKVGMSKLDDTSRIKSYGKNVRLLCQWECTNATIIEKRIIQKFKDTFTLIKGNEYFQGDIRAMKEQFLQVLVDEKKENFDQNGSDNVPNCDDNDEYSLHVTITDYGCVKFKITCNHTEEEHTEVVDPRFDPFMKRYMEQLIENRVIENDKIYNPKDPEFTRKMNEYKENQSVVLSNKNQQEISQASKGIDITSMTTLFRNNALINESFCGILLNDTDSSEDKRTIYVGDYGLHLRISCLVVGNVMIDTDYIQDNCPYLIEINKDGEYYMLNRDYEYIGLGTHSLEHSRDDWERVYLFIGYPWVNGKQCMADAIKSFHEKTKGKNCLNMNEHTQTIISLFES